MKLSTIEQQVIANMHTLPLDKQQSACGQIAKRQAGLGKGGIWTSDDFDVPLPDSFWLVEE